MIERHAIGEWARQDVSGCRHWMPEPVSQAVLLVRPSPGSSWYQALSSRFPCCLTHKRIRFIDASGQEQASPVHGNAFFYLGEQEERFREVFSAIGAVTRPF